MGVVSTDEGFPVNQTLFRDLFVWPRFPLASAFLDDDRFTIHPPLPPSLFGALLRPLFPHRRVNNLLRSNFGEFLFRDVR
jgi:hypothetical protein